MTLEIRLDDSDLVDLIRRMDGFHDVALQEIKFATEQNIIWGQDFLATYPPRPSKTDWGGFVSDKQRRWFFWALNSGLITVPYRRTTTLGPSWQYEVNEFSQGVRGTLSNQTEYMGWVQDETRQAQIHRGRWNTVQMLKRAPRLLFHKNYREALKRVGKRMSRSR